MTGLEEGLVHVCFITTLISSLPSSVTTNIGSIITILNPIFTTTVKYNTGLDFKFGPRDPSILRLGICTQSFSAHGMTNRAPPRALQIECSLGGEGGRREQSYRAETFRHIPNSRNVYQGICTQSFSAHGKQCSCSKRELKRGMIHNRRASPIQLLSGSFTNRAPSKELYKSSSAASFTNRVSQFTR